MGAPPSGRGGPSSSSSSRPGRGEEREIDRGRRRMDSEVISLNRNQLYISVRLELRFYGRSASKSRLEIIRRRQENSVDAERWRERIVGGGLQGRPGRVPEP